MKRLLVVAMAAVTLAAATAFADDVVDATGFVYVVKPGKTALKADAKLDASANGPVAYGQKLVVKKKAMQGETAKWYFVTVPGDKLEGWIPANAVVDKRPGIDVLPVGDAAMKVAAADGASTAGAIRGLDGRTATYAQAKQIPPEALAQLGRIENHAEVQFNDRHSVSKSGQWKYPDVTVPGRYATAQAFAREEGLRAPVMKQAAPAPAASPAPAGKGGGAVKGGSGAP